MSDWVSGREREIMCHTHTHTALHRPCAVCGAVCQSASVPSPQPQHCSATALQHHTLRCASPRCRVWSLTSTPRTCSAPPGKSFNCDSMAIQWRFNCDYKVNYISFLMNLYIHFKSFYYFNFHKLQQLF